MTNNQCIACGHDLSDQGMPVKDFYSSGEEFRIVTCPECGFSYTEPKPLRDDLPSYYSVEKYISHHSGSGGPFLKLYQMVQGFNLHLKRKGLAKRGKHGGRMLDIGCGNGAALQYFVEKGWTGIGVEPASAARQAASLRGLQVYEEAFLQDPGDRKFDVVTMWHVLEHVYDVPERLDQVRSLLTSDGLLVVAVPNPLSFDARFYRNFWAAWDVPRHLYHFTPKSISLLAGEAGFELVSTGSMWFDSFYVAITSEKYKKSGPWGLIRAGVVGLFSNLASGCKGRGTSSIIYYFRPK